MTGLGLSRTEKIDFRIEGRSVVSPVVVPGALDLCEEAGIARLT